MIKSLLLFIFPILFCFSCGNDEYENEVGKEKPTDGYHRAYVEILNSKTNDQSDSAAEVYTKDGNVMKICFSSDRCIDDFDMWDDENDKYEVVFSKKGNPYIYTVYLIPDL